MILRYKGSDMLRKKKRLRNKKLVIVSLLATLLILISFFAISVIQKNTLGMNVEIHEENEINNANNNFKQNLIEYDKNIVFNKIKSTEPVYFPSGSKYVALTFDDGPGYNSTQRILKTLEKYNVKATWFVLGKACENNPEMLKQIAAAGHEIGNHSYSHANFFNLSLNGVLNEVNNTQTIVKNLTGVTPSYVRPPYGNYNQTISSSIGLGIAMWNVDSLDWKLKNGGAAYQQVMSTLKVNPVILFHDIHESSADAIELLVPNLISQGYTFVTYSQHQQIGG